MNNNIPPELQAIKPISSVKECLDIATSIFHFSDSVEKYKVFLAQEFFKNNIFSFTKDEFTIILKNKLFLRKYPGQAAYDILKKCVEDEVVYPVPLHNWFDKGVSVGLHLKYIELLNKENNEEQLLWFNQKAENLIENFFSKTTAPSESLIKIILDKTPHKIFKISTWDDEKIANWIRDNPNNSKDILRQNIINFLERKIDFPKSRQQLYKNILDEYIANPEPSQKEKENIHYTFSSYPKDYIAYVEKNYSELFNNFLHKKFEYTASDASTINGAQILMIRRDDSLHDTIEIFDKYKDLIKQNIKENVGFYTKETSIFEFCIRNNQYKPFVLFSLQDDLSEEDKEMMIAGAFMFLKDRDEAALSNHNDLRITKKDVLNEWCSQILTNCPDNQFSKYIKKLKGSKIKSPEIIKQIEVIEIYRDLNKKPTNQTGKKLKL